MTDTIIVGAGAAGLMAARELVRAGKEVIVLEASDRLGGRVLTLYDTGAGLPVELGAEFIHGDAPETTKLLDEARLVTVDVSGEHYRSDNGELSPQGPVWHRMSRVFRHMNPKRKHDRSFQDFLDENPGGPALANERELARGFVQGFNGADTSLISEKSLAEEGNPTEGASEARRIINGYASLIAYVARDVSGFVRLNSRVAHIAWNADGVRVKTVEGTEFTARTAIITVPLPMLQDNSIAFDPDIPEVRNAARKLVMGHVARVCVVLRERFWEKKVDNLSFVHTPQRSFNVWWTQNPLKAPLLVGWAGGPPALDLTGGGMVDEAAISELAHAFATKRARMEDLVDSIHTHEWSRDSNVRGAYSYAGVGGSHAARVLARSFGNTIFFAGEATDSGSSGTIEAAIASAKRAVRRVLEISTHR